MNPDKTTKCHRIGFQETCFTCVTEYNCRAWVRITGIDKDTGQPIDMYDCADHWGPRIQQQATAQLSEQLTTVAKSVDALRKEVQQANDQQMIGALARLNQKVDEVSMLSHDPQKLLGN